jgi:hypothetical protein
MPIRAQLVVQVHETLDYLAHLVGFECIPAHELQGRSLEALGQLAVIHTQYTQAEDSSGKPCGWQGCKPCSQLLLRLLLLVLLLLLLVVLLLLHAEVSLAIEGTGRHQAQYDPLVLLQYSFSQLL